MTIKRNIATSSCFSNDLNYGHLSILRHEDHLCRMGLLGVWHYTTRFGEIDKNNSKRFSDQMLVFLTRMNQNNYRAALIFNPNVVHVCYFYLLL